MLKWSHGRAGERLLYKTLDAAAINAVLAERYKSEPADKRPRLETHDKGQDGVELRVSRQDARRILVDLLGLDARELGIQPGRSKG